MASEIIMPPLSQTTDEVRLIGWLVKKGEQVKRGDPLCEVETDKVTMEVESFTDGTMLKICSEPDTMVAVGSVIAVVGEPGEKVSALTVEASMLSLEKPMTVAAEIEIKATLLVRNLAGKRSIDLRNVSGTGPGGLITRADLDNFERAGIEAGAETAQPASAETGEMPLSRNQYVVAKTLAKSKAEIPHYYLKSTVYTDNLLAWRERHTLPDGSKISVTSILIHALAKALRCHPKFNSSFKEDRIILRKEININCAVAAGDELYTPVLKTADLKEITELDTELKRLVAKVKNGTLEHQDLLGGTFTITNLGMYPVNEFSAIINPPQAGIIAVGTMEKRLDIDESDRMAIRTACTITGSFDHRIVNGALGAEFMATLKRLIEEEIE